MRKIINEYYCDRCGKKISYEPSTKHVVSNGAKDFIVLHAELCQVCESAFKEWWKGLGEEGEAK